MHIVVIGAGVIGVTSAWYLAQRGCSVTLLEKNAAAALGTSYANVGQISPALSAPWSSPGMVVKAIKGIGSPYSPFVISRVPDAEMRRWLWQFLSNCNSRAYRRNKRRMVELAEYSRDCLRALRQQIDIDYAGRQAGTLVLFRDEGQRAGYAGDLEVLQSVNVPYRYVSADDLKGLEPNLDLAGNGITGGILLPGDETGDCRRFTQELARHATRAGVDIRYGQTVTKLVTEHGRVRAVNTETEEIEADAVIVAMGADSARLLRSIGMSVPVYPVKGYSLTITADSDAVGPHSTVSDETYKIGVTNLGNRIRVGGTAELAGYDLSRREKRYRGLEYVARKLFPSIPEKAIQEAERWSGLRPMTPDGMPRTARIGPDNLYVSTGHGTLGWTMACGSARILADTIVGRKPEIGMALSE